MNGYSPTQPAARLSWYLADHHPAVITTTHHELATELGTAREVVSCLLKAFEHHGWLSLYRGRTEILDRPALRELAGGSGT